MIKHSIYLSSGRDTWLKKDVGETLGSPPGSSRISTRTVWLNRLFLFFVVLLASGKIDAQVSSYSFAQSSDTYVPLASSTVVHSTSWDDARTNVSIPFTFTFNGVGYSTVGVNTNGYVTFGATQSTAAGYTPISAATAYAGAISAFGRDLINNTTTIVSGVEGSSPNRVFVLQWNNARRYDGVNFVPVAGDVINFQVRLYETTNVAQVRYGTCTATSTSAFTTQVGLRGATNSSYLNRTSAANWAATTNGGSNSATVTTTNAIMPASGLTFTWSPPTCSAPGGITGTATSGTAANLSWSAANPAPASGYNWEIRTSGAGGSGPTGLIDSGSTAAGVLTASTSLLTSNTAYTIYVRSNCGSEFSGWGSGAYTSPAITATPYNEGFATTTTPTGWGLSSFSIGNNTGTSGNPLNAAYINLYSSVTTGNFTTINVGPVLANQVLTFDYRLANFSSPYAPPAAGSGNFVVAISVGSPGTELEFAL